MYLRINNILFNCCSLLVVDIDGLIIAQQSGAGFDEEIVGAIMAVLEKTISKIKRFAETSYGKCDEKYLSTIGVSIVEKELQITKRMRVSFFIFDMGGLKSFVKVRRNFYKHSETIMILFDFSRIETLEKVTDWIEEARYFIKDQSVPYILVGNKVHLVENREEIINKAKNLADQHKLELFITSALTGEGLDELFMYLLNFASHLG